MADVAITASSRKNARGQLATLLAEISELVAIYDHQTTSFGGRSPVAMIYSDGTRIGTNYRREDHRFAIQLVWARGTDPESVEDYMDDLAQDVRQKLIDNDVSAGYWKDLQFVDDYSDQGYVEIDDVLYRMETLRVMVWIT